jgi:Protein of unknown function (DUF3574).
MRKIDRCVTLAVMLLTGCAGVDPRTCPAGLKPMTSADLYFGLSIPGGGLVSETDWQRFVDTEITPRFPDGLTIMDAKGQWKDRSGIVREPSKRLLVVVGGKPADAVKLEAIRAAYRARFHQESVLLVETPVCGSF